MTSTAEYKVSGWVVIGETTYPCSMIQVNYQLNSVPSATCILAVGRNALSGTAAAVHKGILERAASQYMQEASIYAKITTATNSAGVTKKIFQGYYAGTGYERIRGRLALSVSLIHWLTDLSFSTCVVDQTHPASPAQMNWRAAYKGDGSGSTGKPVFTAAHVFDQEMQKHKGDLGNGLLELFKSICKKDILKDGKARDCFGTGSNDIALAALNKIKTKGGAGSGSGSSTSLGGNSMNFSGAVAASMSGSQGTEVFNAIGTWIRSKVNESYHLTTVWDKLVGQLLPSFKLALIPRVEDALIVPFTPSVREHGGTIPAYDVDSLRFNGQIPKPMRAVAVMHGIASRTMAFGSSTDMSTTMGVGGCFSAGENTGTVLFVDSPGWLSRVLLAAHSVSETTLGSKTGGKKVTPTATTPQTSGASTGSDAEGKVVAQTKPILQNLAEAIYYQELLRGRRGSVSTNLRWDIAPGSTIKIGAVSSGYVAGDKLEGEAMIGMVERLTIHMDAEGGQTGTTFQLGHYRTESENSKLSVAEHPLYDSTFNGATLL